MHTTEVTPALTRLFAELVDGTTACQRIHSQFRRCGAAAIAGQTIGGEGRSVNDGATIAAHVQHARFGLSLMNRWAAEGGDPFADATWDEAWKAA